MRKRPGETVTSHARDVDALFSLAYEELRRLASAIRRDDPAATINPTALVNEAWIKLAASPGLRFNSPLHFRRVAARAMRQVLIESARRRRAGKRGGGEAVVTFDEALGAGALGAGGGTGDELLALDEAIEALTRLSPRQGQVVESRFFGGFEMGEIAAMLGVSEATVLRDWRAARAWLAREVARR
ncbi:MAG: ECF-type sigma factor [Vicinamibacterales bacterium]